MGNYADMAVYLWGVWMVKKLTSVNMDDALIKDAKRHGVNIGHCANIAVKIAVEKAKETENAIRKGLNEY